MTFRKTAICTTCYV